MLVKIKQFFKEHLEITDSGSPESTEHATQLACAALLIEVSKADFTQDPRETKAMIALIQQQFNLDPVEVDTLVKLAQAETDQASSLYQFTRLVNDFYDYDQKLKLLSAMWQVAYADDNLDKYEEHLIRKVAELIYVTHNDFIRLKISAQALQVNSD